MSHLTPGPPDSEAIFRRSRHPLRLLSLAAATFVLLVVTGLALRPGQDLGLAETLNRLHTGAIGVMTSATYKVLEPVPSIVLTAVLALLIWRVKDLRTGVAFAGVVALTWLPSEFIKLIVHRGRPDIAVMPYPFLPIQTDPSFPSGHTAFMVALAMALAFVVRGTPWHRVIGWIGATLTGLVALALAVDAVHYPSDIVASVAWSLAVAPAARLVWVDWFMPRVPGLAPPGGTRSHHMSGGGAQDDAPATTTGSEPTEQ